MNEKQLQDKDSKPIRVAFYIRVSTEEQLKGFGLDMQRDALNKMMTYKNTSHNWIHPKELEFVDEACSGADLNRNEFQLMMKWVKEKRIDVVAVYKIDRVSRNLSHLLRVFEDLQKENVSFYSIKEDIDFSGPIGKLTFQIFGALAEFERELIKSRTIEGKIASAHQGNYIGNGIPFGYKKVLNPDGRGKKLEIVKDEAEWVKTIFGWFTYDRMSYEEIARELNKLKVAKGLSSKKQSKLTKWYGATIRDMIRNTTYVGIRIERINHEKEIEEIVVKTPVIINEIKFLESSSRFKQIEETKGMKGGGENVYFLSRKLIDITTGRKFVGVERKKNGIAHGFSYRRKNFTDNNGIVHKNLEIPMKEIDDVVWGKMRLAINKPEEFYKIYQKQNIEDREINRKIELREKLFDETNRLKIARLTVENDYYLGKISEENKNELCKKYSRDINLKSAETIKINEAINKVLESKTAQDALDNFSNNFKSNLDKMDIERRCRLVDLMIARIEYEETDEKRDINIVFRFAHRIENNNQDKGEPENSVFTKKNNVAITDDSVIGRGDRT